MTAVLEFDAAANLIREDQFYVGGIDYEIGEVFKAETGTAGGMRIE